MSSHKGIPAQVLSHLYEVIDLVEQDGAAALCSSDYTFFSYTQAYTYRNYYDGLRRRDMEAAILEELYPPTSPYWCWGPLAYHEPILVQTQDIPEYDGDDPNKRAQVLALRKKLPGRLEIYKRPHPCPSTAMWVLRGTVEPTLTRGVTPKQLNTRRKRLIEQCYDEDFRRRLVRTTVSERPDGIWIAPTRFLIERIKQGG